MKRPHLETRCPKLGHQVVLSYCFSGDRRPCSRLFHCWESLVPRLRSVVARIMPEDEFRQAFEEPPPPKAVTLVELIAKAKEREKTKS